MSKTKWGPAVPVLWFIFIMTVAVIAFLSFENGEQSKLWTERIILRVIGKLKPEHNVTNAELLAITYVARQGTRVIAFLFIGMLGTITVHASMRSAGWFVKTFISGGMVLFIAYATEAFKEYIPSKMETGYREIQEPAGEECVNPSEIDIAIIPGVAFDRHCNRLGRGKGFYDRLIPYLECKKIGLSFDFQIVEQVPCEEFDKPLDMVMTEKGRF